MNTNSTNDDQPAVLAESGRNLLFKGSVNQAHEAFKTAFENGWVRREDHLSCGAHIRPHTAPEAAGVLQGLCVCLAKKRDFDELIKHTDLALEDGAEDSKRLQEHISEEQRANLFAKRAGATGCLMNESNRRLTQAGIDAMRADLRRSLEIKPMDRTSLKGLQHVAFLQRQLASVEASARRGRSHGSARSKPHGINYRAL